MNGPSKGAAVRFRSAIVCISVLSVLVIISLWNVTHRRDKGSQPAAVQSSAPSPGSGFSRASSHVQQDSDALLEANESILLADYKRTYAKLLALREECERKGEEIGLRNPLISESRKFLVRLDAYFTERFRSSNATSGEFFSDHPEKRAALDTLQRLSYAVALDDLLSANDPIGEASLANIAQDALTKPDIQWLKRNIVDNEARFFANDNQSSQILEARTPEEFEAALHFFAEKYRSKCASIYQAEFPEDLHDHFRFIFLKLGVRMTLEGYIESEEAELKPFYAEIQKTMAELPKIRAKIRMDSPANTEIAEILRKELDSAEKH